MNRVKNTALYSGLFLPFIASNMCGIFIAIFRKLH
nr:MAG TPA: hypothetical protein [Caudoviricetes sp.]